MSLPQFPVYPRAIDSDRTLYKVYNTSEATITADNQAWAEEISITPQESGDCELWADNGFANLDGELLYYDAVSKNSAGYVTKLRRCLRNLGGTHTHFNRSGTWIRGFVIAEHHLQIVQAILQIENFIGENFSEDEETLDWRIRHLFDEPIIFDDFSCPDVTLNFNIIENDPTQGVIANYLIQTVGQVGSLEIQFGDGQSSTQPSGTHTYAVNATIDPVVNVTNGNCQIVQSPPERTESTQPQVQVPVPPFFVPVPILPDFPPINFPSIPIPSIDLFIPPLITPCFEGGGNLPSVIDFNPPNPVPSQIDFGPLPNFPPIPFDPPPPFNPIPFENVPQIPTSIRFENVPNLPSRISIIGPTSFPLVSFTKPPTISVDWGRPPTISVSCDCRILCPTQPAEEFAAGFSARDDIQVEYEAGAFPTEINVLAPDIAPISVVHDLPKSIAVEMPNWDAIKIMGPDIPLPTEIKLVLDKESLKQSISFSMPESIRLEADPLRIAFPSDLPKFSFADIPELRVVGLPNHISVIGFPDFINLRAPEKVPLVFEGPPLSAEVKITLDVQKLIGDATGLNCVAIVPCGK